MDSLTPEKERMYITGELEEETPRESNHPSDFEREQYLHLVEEDLRTKNRPRHRLLLNVCVNTIAENV